MPGFRNSKQGVERGRFSDIQDSAHSVCHPASYECSAAAVLYMYIYRMTIVMYTASWKYQKRKEMNASRCDNTVDTHTYTPPSLTHTKFFKVSHERL